MNALILLLTTLIVQGEEPKQTQYEISYEEPAQTVYIIGEEEEVKKSKPLPEFLDQKYSSPPWTWPSNKTVWEHLLDPDDPHHTLLIESGYTDRQLRSLSFGQAKALHNHLHNWEVEKNAPVYRKPKNSNKIFFAPT